MVSRTLPRSVAPRNRPESSISNDSRSAEKVEPGPSAYSDLAVLPDGTILCFYESGTDMPVKQRKRDWAYANLTLARFNLQWVTSKP